MTNQTVQAPHADLKAYQVMSHPLFTVASTDSIQDAAALFLENNIGCAPVMDHEQAIGVITKTDLARYESNRAERRGKSAVVGGDGKGQAGEEDRISKWMTPTIFSVSPDTHLGEACRQMIKNGIHHIFVQDDASGRLLGVVTSFDLLKVLADFLNRPLS